MQGQNSANILGPQGNVMTIRASEYISRAQGASKPHFRPRYQIQLPSYKSTTIYDSYTKSGLQPPLTLVNTSHPACHCHSPCPPPTHFHTPPPTLTTHLTTAPLYPNPPLGLQVLSSFADSGKKIALIPGSGDFPGNFIFLIKPPEFNI